MKILLIILLILLITSVITFLIYLNKYKKMREKQEQAFSQLNGYRLQIEKNLNDEIEIGERHLAKELCSYIKKTY